MREILFRGKRVDNGKWVEGSLLKGKKGDADCAIIVPEKELQAIGLDFCGECNRPYDKSFEVFPETVGQYIDKEDKNGKKIFEGDIFIFLYPWGKIHGRVGFSRKNVGFYLYDKNFELMPGMEDCDTMKIVGNKFDTPELWEEKE